MIHIETISNVTNEILFVGSLYKNPDHIVEFERYVKSKYDFADAAAKFFYDNAVVIYKTRSQELNKTTVLTFMSEDEGRLRQYKEFKGWSTIESFIKLADEKSVKNYYEVLKKFSLLREYQRVGFSVEKILNHPKFEMFSAQDVYRLIRGKADKIHTVILTNEEAELLNDDLTSMVNGCLETPDMGIDIPFPVMNQLFRGFQLGSVMCSGMLSNAGKTRYMMYFVAYIALVMKEKVFVMLNEMDTKAVRYCLITTVINNPEFQQLHGVVMSKAEREITLGLYKDAHGEYIQRKISADGSTSESFEEYLSRIAVESEEYRKLVRVCEWVNENSQGLIFAKDISGDYSDESLEFEIRKMALTNSIKYFFYDTMKNDIAAVGEWSRFKVTATRLKEIAKSLNVFVYGSIQLNDSANDYIPDELNSNNIAEAKSIKQVLDTLVLFKELPKKLYSRYSYLYCNEEWGSPMARELDQNKRYYVANIDKNRFGAKKKLLIELDLDKNTWKETGELIKK